MPGTTRERSRIGSAIGRFGTTVRFTELSPTRFRDDGVARHKGLVRAVSSPYAMQDRADHQIVCSRRALCCYAAALGMEKVGLTFVQLAFTLVSAYLSLFVACSAILYFLHCSKRNLAAGFSITTRQMNVPYWFRGVIQIRPQENPVTANHGGSKAMAIKRILLPLGGSARHAAETNLAVSVAKAMPAHIEALFIHQSPLQRRTRPI
jgi:hypothetical protein